MKQIKKQEKGRKTTRKGSVKKTPDRETFGMNRKQQNQNPKSLTTLADSIIWVSLSGKQSYVDCKWQSV